MKIAFVVPYVPNLIRTRSYNLITHLAALGHEVVVFTLGSNQQDLKDVELLRTKCADVIFYDQPTWRSLLNSAFALPTTQPLQSVYSWNPGLAKTLTDIVENARKDFDVFHVEHLRGSKYGTLIRKVSPNIPVIWDSVDSISHLFKQASRQSKSFFGKLIPLLELSRTQRAEGKLICQFNHILVTSPSDKKALLELTPKKMNPAPISVLPNGVNLDYFRVPENNRRDKESLVFSGKMSYHANISMVKYLLTDIMPIIWRQRPNTHVTIVGKEPPPSIKKFAENPLVTVTGTVEDIRPYLWRATVAVVPLVYGAGIQNKVLEAMASSTPVVASTKATSALQTISGQDVFTSDRPDEFARNVLHIIENQKIQQELGQAGLRYVQKHHSWIGIAHQLTEIYKKVTSDAGGNGERNNS